MSFIRESTACDKKFISSSVCMSKILNKNLNTIDFVSYEIFHFTVHNCYNIKATTIQHHGSYC